MCLFLFCLNICIVLNVHYFNQTYLFWVLEPSLLVGLKRTSNPGHCTCRKWNTDVSSYVAPRPPSKLAICCVPISSVIKNIYLDAWQFVDVIFFHLRVRVFHLRVRVDETVVCVLINGTFIQLTLLWFFLILQTEICTGSMLSQVRRSPNKLVQIQGVELCRMTDE